MIHPPPQTQRRDVKAFLDRLGWGGAEIATLAGDASNRRYDRLTPPETDARAVLMDAPPQKGEDVGPFLNVAAYLTALGLSAPRILGEDREQGYLLLEDLGDDLFARLLRLEPEAEETLYHAAADVLLTLGRNAPPAGLPPLDASGMARLAALAWTWYAPGITEDPGTGPDPEPMLATLTPILQDVMDDGSARVLAQRDFHAENLIWLPERDGAARVGLLDFQDAVAGHPAYDLVSLLEDARRDVRAETVTRVKDRFIQLSGSDAAAFELAYAALGAQRNLRILGVFARLSLHFAKPHYVDLIPRVWGHLHTDLAHPRLAGLRDLVLRDLPEPTPKRLQRLKDRCGTIPTL